MELFIRTIGKMRAEVHTTLVNIAWLVNIACTMKRCCSLWGRNAPARDKTCAKRAATAKRQKPNRQKQRDFNHRKPSQTKI